MCFVQEQWEANGTEVRGWTPLVSVKVGCLAVGTGLPLQRLRVQGRSGLLVSSLLPNFLLYTGFIHL